MPEPPYFDLPEPSGAPHPIVAHVATLEAVIKEAHKRLDRAGVPAADGQACDDATCETKLGHRIKLLIAERDELRSLLDEVPPGT